MKIILTIKRGNKDAVPFCKELELSPQECDTLKEIARSINSKAGEECVTVYVKQIQLQ